MTPASSARSDRFMDALLCTISDMRLVPPSVLPKIRDARECDKFRLRRVDPEPRAPASATPPAPDAFTARPILSPPRAMVSVNRMELTPLIDKHLPRTIDLRHRLHQIPELGYEEFKTAAAIRAALDQLGIRHVDDIADSPTATIAWIGDTSKPCI